MLLALSGWFITAAAAAAAGLAGAGAVFDAFRPSAMVRFLALGRTAARYGERFLTHDVTLRALSSLRVRLLWTYAAASHDRLVRLRGAQILNRVMADVDALDGVPLRLILPLLSGLVTLITTFGMVWALVEQLAVYGQLSHACDAALAADAKRQADRVDLDLIDRRTGLALSVLGTFVAGGALAFGMVLARTGATEPGFAAMGFFTALALMETITPLRRAVAEVGRMAQAARRIRVEALPHASATSNATARAVPLRIKGLGFERPGAGSALFRDLSLAIGPGETLAVTGESGAGKSTLLLLIARELTPTAGRITLGARPLQDWTEPDLRAQVMLVPQRSALLAGTLREALLLAAPEATDPDLWHALEAVALAAVIRDTGGLDLRLGPRGQGLSGGAARRLVLARALLRQPAVLLLDEPTEGLGEDTARKVQDGIRLFLPQSAILTASHRRVEIDWAQRVLAMP